MRCGITGSSGFIGSGILKNFSNIKFVKFKGDIKNKKVVFNWVKNNQFDIVIHLAGLVSVKKAELNYQLSKDVNYFGTKNLIDALLKFKPKLKWFLFSSSAHVYELKKDISIKESSKKAPFTKYGKTKLLAENYIKKLKYIPFCIVRIFNLADVKQKNYFFFKKSKNLIKKNKGKIVKFKDLNHYRDFINLDTLTKTLKKIYFKRLIGVYNVGSGKKTYLFDLINKLCFKYKKVLLNKTTGQNTYLVANIKKLEKNYLFLKKV